MSRSDFKRDGFDLGGVVPWGRRYWEYREIFRLDDLVGDEAILDVAAGPSSFAAEAGARGFDVIACDPLYAHEGTAIRRRFDEAAPKMRAGMARAHERFDWSVYGDAQSVFDFRKEALDRFLADYATGRAAGRYIAASLPVLPFSDQRFDLALVSHLLFLYGDDLSLGMHIASLLELVRVARIVRVYPLINLDGRPSSHLEGVRCALHARGIPFRLRAAGLGFQRGATHMLEVGAA